VASSEIGLLTVDELEMYISLANYFANAEDKIALKNLNTEQAKRDFLFDFWQARDENKETPIFESFREVMKRVQFANENCR